MRRINQYFFGVDQIGVSDFLWFYGGIVCMVLIGLIGF